jgi:hypothetical protein
MRRTCKKHIGILFNGNWWGFWNRFIVLDNAYCSKCLETNVGIKF